MRKFFSLILVVAMLAGVSCTTDVTEDLAIGIGGKTELTVSLEGSRIALGDKVGGEYQALWSEGDKISINGIASGEAAIDDANKALATFSFEGALATPYNVVYPAAAAGKVTFAAEQSFVNGTFSAGATPMYGYTESASGVTLHHLAGVLKIGVTGEATLINAQVSTIDRAPIAGLFDIDCATGEVTATESATEVISYSFGEGLALSSEAQYIHIAVPAGVYNELYVTLYDSEGGVMYATVKATDEKPLNAGAVREFKTPITYEATDAVFVIRDVESLQAFAAQAATLEKSAILVADIDVSEVEWTPIEGYAKTLLGNGYAIKGLKAPLFGTTSASIKGLHLEDIAIVTNDLPIAGALACVVQGIAGATVEDSYVPTIENCSVSGTFTIKNTTYASNVAENDDLLYGSLIGMVVSANIRNCTNNATVNAEQVVVTGNTIDTHSYIGGVLGYVTFVNSADDATVYSSVDGIVNNGEINYLDSSNAGNDNFHNSLKLGGIVGRCYDAINFDNNVNYGDINMNSKTLLAHVGGIAGQFACQSASNNINRGDITMDGRLGNLYFGGFSGYANCKAMDEPHNYGTILVKESATIFGTCSGGLFGYLYSASSSDTQCRVCTNGSNNAPISVLASTDVNTPAKGYYYRVGGLIGFNRAQTNNLVNNKEGVITLAGDYKMQTADNNYHIAGAYAYKTVDTTGRVDNYADINIGVNLSFANEETTGGTIYIGGLQGYTTQATGTGSTNYGDINITSAITTETLYIAGGTAQGTLMGITNEGDINIAESADINCTDLYLGGVCGLTSHTSSRSGYSNKGNISLLGSLKSTTAYAGGVIGYSCFNPSDITNSGNINITGETSGMWHLGGCIGYSKGGKHANFTNSGSITMAGKVTTDGFRIAGCIGYLLSTKKDTVYAASSFTNSGPILYNASNSSGGTAVLGGILGYNGNNTNYDLSLTDFTNEATGTVTLLGNHVSATYVSGIATWGHGEMTNCVNKAKLVHNATVHEGHCYMSGLAVRCQQAIHQCENHGDVEIAGVIGGNLYFGGIVTNANGYIREDCINEGDITVSAKVGAKTETGVALTGGICYNGSVSATYRNCHNRGNITYTKDADITKTICCAGIIPQVADDQEEQLYFEGCSNSGNILIESPMATLTAGRSFVAGLVAINSGKNNIYVQNGFTNSGNITINGSIEKAGSDFDGCLFVGGVLGEAIITDTSAWTGNVINSGKITVNGSTAAASYIGGIVAYSYFAINGSDSTFLPINTGDIEVASGAESNFYVGGITGASLSTINNAQVYYNLVAGGRKNAGMIMGSARLADETAPVLATACKVGGTITIEVDDDGDYSAKPIKEDNFFNYIYNTQSVWPDETDYDGCSFLASKEDITYITVTPPAE